MATYKLIQDIEAEDHILGPLSFRQFLFALTAVFFLYLSFIAVAKHVLILLIFFAPPALFFLFFAFPFGRDQPTEVWALAKLRFLFKPRRRIWSQSGIKQLVTITVPKKIEPVLTNGLTQSEVKSRLQALANTIDSRGWAIKNVNVNETFAQNGQAVAASDRLVDVSSMPREVPNYDVQAADDMLDERSNPVAQQFQAMITQSSQQHRKQLIDELNGIRKQQAAQQAAAAQPAENWFMGTGGHPLGSTDPMTLELPAPQAAATTLDQEEADLTQELKTHVGSKTASYGNLRTLQPDSNQVAQAAGLPPAPVAPPVTAAPDPAILSLASNNDLNVATLAREADKAKRNEEPHDGEVVISLH